MFDEIGSMVGTLLRLEADRIEAAAALGRPNASHARDIAEVDADMSRMLAGLDRRGVAYPPHAVAARYELSGAEYLVLMLALLPHHAPDVPPRLSRVLGPIPTNTAENPAIPVRLSWALRLLAPQEADHEALARQVETSTVVAEGLVRLTRMEDGDRRLEAHLAVLELLGLG